MRECISHQLFSSRIVDACGETLWNLQDHVCIHCSHMAATKLKGNPLDHEKECVGAEIDTPLMAASTFQHVVALTGQIVRRPSRNPFPR